MPGTQLTSLPEWRTTCSALRQPDQIERGAATVVAANVHAGTDRVLIDILYRLCKVAL
jgi:hypothetical protein